MNLRRRARGLHRGEGLEDPVGRSGLRRGKGPASVQDLRPGSVKTNHGVPAGRDRQAVGDLPVAVSVLTASGFSPGVGAPRTAVPRSSVDRAALRSSLGCIVPPRYGDLLGEVAPPRHAPRRGPSSMGTAGTHAKVRYRCFLPDLAGFTSPRRPDHKLLLRTPVQRRGWDSNPRYPFRYTRVPGVRLQPLGHLSSERRA